MSSIEEALAENQKTPAIRKISLYCSGTGIQFNKECRFYMKQPTSNRVNAFETNLTDSCKHIDK